MADPKDPKACGVFDAGLDAGTSRPVGAGDDGSDSDHSRWFSDEVQPHEPALRSYLYRHFPTVRDVDDVVQESFVRLLDVRRLRPIQYTRALLFKVARHLAIDLVRRSNVSPVRAVSDLDGLDVEGGGGSPADEASVREKIWLMAQAIDALPPRCRQVVVLRKVKMLSQRDVAERLGLSERTVESQLARGLRRCETYLRKRGIDHLYRLHETD